jgi:hypothetical protein
VRGKHRGDGEYMPHLGCTVSLDVDVCTSEVEGCCYVYPGYVAFSTADGS